MLLYLYTCYNEISRERNREENSIVMGTVGSSVQLLSPRSQNDFYYLYYIRQITK